MKRTNFFQNSGRRYLQPPDIPDGGVRLRIKDCREVEVGTPPHPKPVVYFHGEPRGLILNATNWDALEALFGPESDGWIGHAIHLFTEPGTYQGKSYVGMRLRAAADANADRAADVGAEQGGVGERDGANPREADADGTAVSDDACERFDPRRGGKSR